MSEPINLLRKNQILKNKHDNERCFIIGNGPSLNQQDISILSDQLTIAVNGFWQHPLCQTVNASYWIYADPSIWTKSEIYLDPMIEYFDQHQYDINLLLPMDKRLDKDFGEFVEPYYFSYDKNRDISSEIDLSNGIPPYGQNVLSVALMLAMYMGCSEIVLVGMDHTWWQWRREEYEGSINPLCYSHPHHHKAISDYRSYDWLQNTISIQINEYYQLLKYSMQKNIKIANATYKSALDIFPKVNFEEAFDYSHSLPDYTADDIHIEQTLYENEKDLYQRGIELLAHGIINDAINSFFMLLRINPKHSFSYLQLARIYFFNRQNKLRGEEYFKNAITISPELEYLSEHLFLENFDTSILDYEYWKQFNT